MTLETATTLLREYLAKDYLEFKEEIVWKLFIDSPINETRIAILHMPEFEPIIVTFHPMKGIVVYDTVAIHPINGEWKEV